MRKFVYAFSLFFLAVLLAVLWNTYDSVDSVEEPKPAGVATRKLKVVATIFPPYDFARQIAAGRAELAMLVRPGSEVHSYDPSPQDILLVRGADVFIYIGGDRDAWVDTLLESMDTSDKTDKTDKKIVRLMDHVNTVVEEIAPGMQAEEDHDSDAHEAHEAHEKHDTHELDEHIWTAPRNAALLVQVISDALCERDPANADFYRANAAAYVAQIDSLDKEIASIVAGAKRKKIVVGDKFPFRYLADEFGLDYAAAFPGCSTESDCSAATLAYLINTVKNERIPCVYYVELSNRKIADAIAEQTGAMPLLLHSCHNLAKVDFEAGATYVSLMKQNAENLRKGLN